MSASLQISFSISLFFPSSMSRSTNNLFPLDYSICGNAIVRFLIKTQSRTTAACFSTADRQATNENLIDNAKGKAPKTQKMVITFQTNPCISNQNIQSNANLLCFSFLSRFVVCMQVRVAVAPSMSMDEGFCVCVGL